MTIEERCLLQKLASGELDGRVGDIWPHDSGAIFWKTIENGIPIKYKKSSGTKFFDGKENVRVEGAIRVYQKWKTDEEKLDFLRQYGHKMQDPDVKAYSKKFK